MSFSKFLNGTQSSNEHLGYPNWIKKNIAKGTTDPWVEFICITGSKCTVNKTWTYYNFRISIKQWFQNLNQTSTSKLKILTKPCFRILTKIQLHNLNQTSAAKYWYWYWYKIDNVHRKLSLFSPKKWQTLASLWWPHRSLAPSKYPASEMATKASILASILIVLGKKS